MRIGFDVDGVLADFNPAYIQRCITLTGKNLFPEQPFDIVTWNYPESYGYTTDEVSAVWKSIKADTSFWANLKPYPLSNPYVHRIGQLTHQNDQEVYFITSRPGATAKRQSEIWLAGYFGITAPTVLLSSEKGECAHALGLSHYIDDRTENCEDVVKKSPSTACYMLAQPWNREIPGTPRIASVTEFIDLLS